MKLRIPQESLASVRAFFCDIDGTLIDNKSILKDETIAAVRSLAIPFSLVSGRNWKGMSKIYAKLGLSTPMLTLNGACISQNGKVLAEETIPAADIQAILKTLGDLYGEAISLETYDASRWYCNTLKNPYIQYEAKVLGFQPDVIYTKPEDVSALPMAKLLVIAESSACDKIETILAPYRDHLQVIRNHDTYIEIFSKQASKGKAIRKAAEILGIPIEQTLCAGDSPIDLSMFLTCPFRVAVANADPIILAHSNIITDTNDANGIAKFIALLNEARH
jgi:Cof subfamily protein (haloacid dehalogenase superfamily)